jgi:hypothetical protein
MSPGSIESIEQTHSIRQVWMATTGRRQTLAASVHFEWKADTTGG